jgi:CHAT domain-containing protein
MTLFTPLFNCNVLRPVLSFLFLVSWALNTSGQNNATLILPELDAFIQESRALTGQREFVAAFDVNAKAFTLAEACCGQESAAYAEACFNEGRIHHIKGDYQTAVEWYVPSMRIRKRVLGDLHEDYGKSLNNLAVAYKKLGRFESAEPLYKGALLVRRNLFGERSAPFAAALGNLAVLYRELGNYEDAEALNLKALEIRKEVLGDQHPHYVLNLLNLGAFYYEIDQFDKAETYYLRVKTYYESSSNTQDIDYLKAIDNLGSVYLAKRDYELAEKYYLLALQEVEKELGPKNELTATVHNHLGLLHLETAAFDKGQYHLEKALSTLEALDMKTHQSYGFYRQNLGSLFYEMGAYEQAKQEQTISLSIILQCLGKHHRRYREGLRQLIQTEFALNELEQAAENLRVLAVISRLPLQNAVRHLSETEMAQYAEDFRENLNYYFTLTERYPAVADLCFDEILLHRGFLLNKALRVNQFLPADSLGREYLEQLRGVHRQLAAQYATPLDARSELTALEEEADRLEKVLAREIAKLGNIEDKIDWQTIQSTLESGEAVLEFVYYTDRIAEHTNKLGVLLLMPNLTSPLFIPLCTEDELDRSLQRLGNPEQDYINDLYTYAGRGKQIYELVWQPLNEKLANFPELSKLYVVKAGNLHRLNLAALPTSEGKTLSDAYQLSLLTSSRELLEKRQHPVAQDATAVLFGAIDYDATLSMTTADVSSFSEDMNRGVRFQSDPSRASTAWQPLPWTEVEIINAQDLLEPAGFHTISQMENRATESFFKEIGKPDDGVKSPLLIHLATHGYFFPDPDELRSPVNHNIAAAQHPMIRSGLILAGANAAWTNQNTLTERTEDGILTAYEISHLDLSNTELVILSACETGLGDVQSLEGVYGLQRAFQVAGSRYVMMTLWQISDYQAQLFMEHFYRFWLTEKQDIRSAFSAARLEMRKAYPAAFHWAGFVLLE